jgi:hypothetical protein
MSRPAADSGPDDNSPPAKKIGEPIVAIGRARRLGVKRSGPVSLHNRRGLVWLVVWLELALGGDSHERKGCSPVTSLPTSSRRWLSGLRWS